MYPTDYRNQEVRTILGAVRSGECFSLLGLSGAGKTNLLKYLAGRNPSDPKDPDMVFLDGNRLEEPTCEAFFRLGCRSLEAEKIKTRWETSASFEQAITQRLESKRGLCLLTDLSMTITRYPDLMTESSFTGALRAVRDAFKYKLSFLIASRHPLPENTEISELFFAHTQWLGPLSPTDARWSIETYLERKGVPCDKLVVDALSDISGRYPSLVRAVCEAYADCKELAKEQLVKHPAVQSRLKEFWSDNPTREEIKQSRLDEISLLRQSADQTMEDYAFTAKEQLLLSFFREHTGEICTKDEIIRAVWSEDRILERGIRDDSLSQLVRRLREKIESDPSQPNRILTIPGRGYRFQS
jgi:ABC-type cobalamin/Fe3+-siderophores transport system ATPase subunit